MSGEEPREADRRAMRWRASRRGMLEVSVILSGYLEENEGGMRPDEFDAMRELLELPDADLWDMLVAESAAAPLRLESLVGDLRAHSKTISNSNGRGV